ncbi:hypothetical protein AB205_0045850 [Aquarana catesbeiana]|uniref:Uncharacterized protein n=1 Tax=Aquarana catesbeiana TaxID=8400 RepID=A0A2G9QN78_AQUCT|nr:hypothetical protein AB205_0045850 [Aquarana catesbeiana]
MRTLQDYCRKGKKKEERSITHHTAQRRHIILTMEVIGQKDTEMALKENFI